MLQNYFTMQHVVIHTYDIWRQKKNVKMKIIF